MVLGAFAAKLFERNPAMCTRLGAYARSQYLIDPVDLPIVLRLVPDPQRPVLEPFARRSAPQCDARISGRLLNLIALVSGEVDGDALFFTRDVEFSGDTEAVLALRNAIDATGFDLMAEVHAMFGPAAYPLRFLHRGATAFDAAANRLQRHLLAPAFARLERIERELESWRGARDDRERKLWQRQQLRRKSKENTIDVHAGT